MKKNIQGMKAIVSFVLSLVLCLSLLAGCGAKNQENSSPETNTVESEQLTSEKAEEETTEEKLDVEEETEGLETVALFGVDTRAKELNKGTRSDSVMVAVINHETKEIRLASIFRDTYVEVEGHGLTKFTHAHQWGGPELALATLNDNFDLHMEDYVTVNFLNVRDLVDELGGIEMEITESEAKYINKYIDELNRINKTSSVNITEKGNYILDGTQAVAYSRIRYTAGGDYKRAERQRVVLFKIFEKAKDLNKKDLLLTMEHFMDNINTNYSKAKLTKVLYYLSKYEIVETKAFPTKLWGGKIGKLWYAVPVTLKSNTIELHEFLYPETEYTPSERVEELSSIIEEYASTPNEVLAEDPALDNQ